MVRYFEKGLKPSIKAKMDQNVIHLDNYKELVAKAVRVEAKTSLQPSSYIRETDIQILQRSRPIQTTAHKVQMQEASRGDDFKVFKAPASTQKSELSDKARKDKKKRHYRDRRDFREPKNSTTSASKVNAVKVGNKRRRNKKDLSGITYYNCNKKRHFADKCPEPRRLKNKYWSWQPLHQQLVLEKRLWNASLTSTIRSNSRRM